MEYIKWVFGAITVFGFLYLYYSIYVKDAPSIFDKKDTRWWEDVFGLWGYGGVKEWIVISTVLTLATLIFLHYFPDNSMALLLKNILHF